MVVVVTTAAYSSMLVAELSVTKRLATFQTLDDVVSQGEYTWGTLGFGSTHVILSVRDVVHECVILYVNASK